MQTQVEAGAGFHLHASVTVRCALRHDTPAMIAEVLVSLAAVQLWFFEGHALFHYVYALHIVEVGVCSKWTALHRELAYEMCVGGIRRQAFVADHCLYLIICYL